MRRQLAYSALLAGLIIAGLFLVLGPRSTRGPGSETGSQAGRNQVAISRAPRADAPRGEETPASGDRSATKDAADPARTLFFAGVACADTLESPLVREEIRVWIRQGTRSSLRRITTGPGGEFRIGGLGPGPHSLTFEHDAYRPVDWTSSLLPGKPASDLVVLFPKGLRAWGRVRDLQDGPARDVVLEWARKESGKGPIEVSTDESGGYEIGSLEPGPYLVRVVPKLTRAAWKGSSVRQITVRDGVPNRFDIVADVGTSLPVLVLGEDRRPVPSVQVRFRLSTRNRGISGYLPATGDDGKTVLRGLPAAGTLKLQVLHEDRELAQAEFGLEALPGEVSLVVSSSG